MDGRAFRGRGNRGRAGGAPARGALARRYTGPMTTYLILGASRGVGHGLAMGLPGPGDTAYLVSRSLTAGSDERDDVMYHSLAADLAKPDAPARLVEWLGDIAIDLCIYNAGVWETGWMRTPFEQTPDEEMRAVIETNLIGLIFCIRAVLPHLRRAAFGRIVIIGSISGLDNEGASPVAYAASKFGARGAAHALRAACRADGIAVTCVNPGWIANDVAYEEDVEAALARHECKAIPIADIVELVRAVLRLSRATCVKEINMPAMADRGA